MKQALISVSDKTGVLELAKELHLLHYRLISTGGTAKMLREAGLPVADVAEITGSPEILDGRVKTLHPKIHGGLLGRLDFPTHQAEMDAAGITPISLLVVNLYPFEATVDKPDCTLEDAIENIDIGGPAMVRAGAKNWHHVGVLTDVAQYPMVIDELKQHGELSNTTRFTLAVTAFNRIAQYDAAISNYLSSVTEAGDAQAFPLQINHNFVKVQDLRYGENPHQSAAFYRHLDPMPGTLATYEQLQGKALSFNNLADADAAWECARQFTDEDGAACVIVKHANPCGVGVGASSKEAYQKALATDTASAFGGIIAFNQGVGGVCAEAIVGQFVEVVIAPDFSNSALEFFSKKPNIRILRIPHGAGKNAWDIKAIGSGLLVQSADTHRVELPELKVVTVRAPSLDETADLLFAWRVAKFVKSNAIVYAHAGQTLGIGAGQMSRVDSARIAAIKAEHAGLSLKGCAVASDAFFPFRDGLDVLADAGATAVIQPGGSMRDDEVINAANERGIAMVFTGVRHFRH